MCISLYIYMHACKYKKIACDQRLFDDVEGVRTNDFGRPSLCDL